jgi:hypothetical protein
MVDTVHWPTWDARADSLVAGARRWPAGPQSRSGHQLAIWDKLGLWFAVAAALAAIAYAIPLWDLLQLTRYGSPGYKLF